MTLDLARFQRICGLLGSEHDGERAAAAAKATAMLKAAGLSWADVSVGRSMAVPDLGRPWHHYAEENLRRANADAARRKAAQQARSSVDEPEDWMGWVPLKKQVEYWLDQADAVISRIDRTLMEHLAAQNDWTERNRVAGLRALRRVWAQNRRAA